MINTTIRCRIIFSLPLFYSPSPPFPPSLSNPLSSLLPFPPVTLPPHPFLLPSSPLPFPLLYLTPLFPPLFLSLSPSIPFPLSLPATRDIRALGYKAPVIGVTGNSLPTDVEHFKSHGANVVLIKPLDFDVFKSAMAGGLLILMSD